MDLSSLDFISMIPQGEISAPNSSPWLSAHSFLLLPPAFSTRSSNLGFGAILSWESLSESGARVLERGTWWPKSPLGDWDSPGFGENSQLTIQPPTLPPIQLVREDVPLSDLRVHEALSFCQSPSHGLRFFCLP